MDDKGYSSEFDLTIDYQPFEHIEVTSTTGVFLPGKYISSYENELGAGFGETAWAPGWWERFSSDGHAHCDPLQAVDSGAHRVRGRRTRDRWSPTRPFPVATWSLMSQPRALAALLTRLTVSRCWWGLRANFPLPPSRTTRPAPPWPSCQTSRQGALLLELSRAVASMPDDWSVEIVEAHHDQKRDAPSGTAADATGGRRCGRSGRPPDPRDSLGRHGRRTHHLVVGAGRAARDQARGDAPRVFAIGALRWASWLGQQPAGLHRPWVAQADERCCGRRLPAPL